MNLIFLFVYGVLMVWVGMSLVECKKCNECE